MYWFPIENGVTAAESHLCDTKDFDDIELSKLGKKQSLEAFAEAKGIVKTQAV